MADDGEKGQKTAKIELKMTKFQQFVSKIEHGNYSRFRDAILQRLTPRISEQTFRNWERGIYEPDEIRRDAINAVAVELTGKPVYLQSEKNESE